MKVLNRPMFRYGGPIKEGIMSGIQEPRRQGYAEPPGFVIQNDPNKIIVDRLLNNQNNAARVFENVGKTYDQDLNNQAFALPAIKKTTIPKKNIFTSSAAQDDISELSSDFATTVRDPESGQMIMQEPQGLSLEAKAKLNLISATEYAQLKKAEEEAKKNKGTSIFTTEDDTREQVASGQVKPDVELPGDTPPPPPTKKERVNTILESLGYDRAQKNALYDAMIKAGQRVSRGGLGADNLVSDVIAETSQSYDKPEKLREAANLMDVQQQLKLDQIEASKSNTTEQTVDFLMSNKGGNKTKTEALDIVLKNPRNDDEAYDKAFAETKGDVGRAVTAAVNYAVERDLFDKPLGIIDTKKYDDPKEFFEDKSVYKGPGNYIIGGTVIEIDSAGKATTIKKYYTSKKNESFLAKFGIGTD